MALGLNRMGLVDGESRAIAVPIPPQAGRVIPLVFRVCECLGLGGSQFGVVTSFLAFLASREVALVLRVGGLSSLQRGQVGGVALVPAVLAILRVTLVLCSRYI